MRYSIITVILTAYDVRDTLFRSGCSCIPAARSRGNFASERIACMRDVIHRERITCRTRRFIGGKTKNKHQAGGLWRKKKRIEGNLRSIKVSPGNVASFPSSRSRFCHLRSAVDCTIEFLQACRMSSRNILYIPENVMSAVARVTSIWRCIDSEFINLELGNRFLPHSLV